MKILIPLAAGMLLPAMLLAATPTPTPIPSPTPVRAEISGFRVPIGSSVIYGATAAGVLVRVRVNADGVVMTMPVPTPTP